MSKTKHLDWITDPHLDHFRSKEMLISFVDKLYARDSAGLLITGDIAESHNIVPFMEIVGGAYQRPVYFVLGNHDYYGGWMAETQSKVRELCRDVPHDILNWMSDRGPVWFDDTTALIGHDGFYDGQEGAPGLGFAMTDFCSPHGIHDLIQALGKGSHELFEKLLELGQNSADHVHMQATKAYRKGARRILVLTHVPPFLGASYYRGRPSEPRAAPFYVNKSMGDVLLDLANEMPDATFEVYAGHTHGKREYRPCENMVVRVGNARYGRHPTFQAPIEL